MLPVNSLNNPLIAYIKGWANIIEIRWTHDPSEEFSQRLAGKWEELAGISEAPEFEPYQQRVGGNLRTFMKLGKKYTYALSDFLRDETEKNHQTLTLAREGLDRFLDAHFGLALLAMATDDPVGVYFGLDRALIAGALGVTTD